MSNKIIIIGLVVISTLNSCEEIKKCCSKVNSKTEKTTEGVCNKCGEHSCSTSCNLDDTLKIK